MQKKARYITTTLPYVNADPHVGFALELVQADALARYWRLMAKENDGEVFFNTGTDEHGQKIADKAKEAGQDVKEYVDHYAGEFQNLKEALNISYDAFIRTTDEKHIKAAQEIWKRCAAKGDIYKKKYKGLYCVGCEMFLRDSDMVDGKCPNHPNQVPQEVEEENYFFALSKYQDKLLKYLEQDDVIVPEWRREEAIKFVEGGLEDFSISREKARLSWGIPVPDDDDQIFYVWFDALTNYISTLDWPDGENFKKFWEDGETLQMAGKDQIRFQSIMWQAMLMSADVKPTDRVLYHGFINSGGQKMSKSLGNVISPYDLVARYGTDATRYILLRHVHPFDDSDVTFERMDEWYTANLVNGLGNLVARILKMSETYGVQYNNETKENIYLENFQFQQATDKIWAEVQVLDEFIQKEQPFKKIKTDEGSAKKDVFFLLSQLSLIATHLQPFMPETSKIIQEAVKANKKPENLFKRLEE
jgi:methionyl-tRNA synthetase